MNKQNTKHPLNPFMRPAILMSLAILVLMLISCNLPSLLAATSTPTTASTPLSPLNTATPMPASPEPATATPAPSASPTSTLTATPSAVNIVFTTGTTAAVEQGSLQPNQVQAYTLNAGQYQPMILSVSSPNNDI